MSNSIIRDSYGKVKYKLQENKLYGTTKVRDASGHTVVNYNNQTNLKTTTEKLRIK